VGAIIHLYHYDDDKAHQPLSTPAAKEEPKRSVKKAQMAPPAPLQNDPSDLPPNDPEVNLEDEDEDEDPDRKGIPGAFSGTYEVACT
jgi:hypothetical protein